MMNFEDLKAHLQSVEMDELRFNMDDYMEFVVRSHAIDRVKNILEGYFGHEINLREPSTHHEEAVGFVEKWGGIRTNQTLYFLPNGQSAADYAMIWPWSDGAKASIKVAQCKPKTFLKK